MLTGESVPAVKDCVPAKPDAPLGDRTCMGFSGTLAVYGQAIGVVTATGDSAEIGKINKLVGSVAGIKTPLLTQLESFGRILSLFSILLAIITFAVAMTRPAEEGYSFGEAFRIAVTVAVAIIPEVRRGAGEY